MSDAMIDWLYQHNQLRPDKKKFPFHFLCCGKNLQEGWGWVGEQVGGIFSPFAGPVDQHFLQTGDTGSLLGICLVCQL